MLFRKKIEPRCAYCAKGSQINDEEVACIKRGIVSADYHCGSFSYDPLRRVPPRPVKLKTEKLSEEDFKI